MLTVDTITDADIEGLLKLAKAERRRATVYLCKIALDDGVVHQPASRIREARGRVAEILNARGHR